MGYLLVVDDQKIRHAAFQTAAKLFKKINRLETDLASFRTTDQLRFEDWEALTFRHLQERMKQSQGELRRLYEFHNWVVALSHQKKISMIEAYRLLKREEELFNNGTEVQRQEIEKERQKREEFIRAECEQEAREERAFTEEWEREFGEVFGEEFGDAWDEDSDYKADRESDRESNNESESEFDEPQGPKRTAKDEQEFQSIVGLTDEKLSAKCRNPTVAFTSMLFILSFSRTFREMCQVLRLWNLLSPANQAYCGKKYSEIGRGPIKILLQELEDIRSRMEKFDKRHGHPKDANASSESEDRVDSVKKEDKTQEQVKLVYRKLVRRLHPDMQIHQNANRKVNGGIDENAGGWQKEMWQRVQSAYQARDLKELNKLFHITLLRSGALRELTLSEIEESASWLEEELSFLQDQAKSLKHLPAWGFSRKKDLSGLERKIEKKYTKDLESIEQELEEIRDQFEMMELFANTRSGRRRSKTRSSSKSRVSPDRRRRR